MTDFLEIFRTLERHNVDYILVGGLAAVLAGAPITTFDCDIVHSRTTDNIDRLLLALADMEAMYRLAGGRNLASTAAHLGSRGHQLLSTKWGPLDVLGEIGEAMSYDDLLPHSKERRVSADCRVFVLQLHKLIESKEQAGQEKDQATLPILRRTLEQSRGEE